MKEKVWKWIKVKVLEFRKVWEDDMKGMCDGDQCVGVRALWDGCYAVQVGSMRGLHTGDRCKPRSRFMEFPFFLMWMASMVLLFQCPVAVAWTFTPSQSIECWNFCVCTAIPFLGSSQHTCFSSVCELAVTAGHFIHNISFLLHWGLLLHSHHYAPQCLLGLGLTHQNKPSS